jgi:hypothetical protein
MLSWMRRRGERAETIDAEADALMGELGVEAYAEARRREYESSGDAIALRWSRVALAVAHKTGERIGLDTSSRMAMNAVFAPDREHGGDRQPQPFSQADELKGALARKPCAVVFHCPGRPAPTPLADSAKGRLGGGQCRNQVRERWCWPFQPP